MTTKTDLTPQQLQEVREQAGEIAANLDDFLTPCAVEFSAEPRVTLERAFEILRDFANPEASDA